MSEIIFHHYPSSPFSEKARVAFGIKNLSWRAVEQPIIMPKPFLTPLTGGYRKIPVMQIGADIFCDSQIILRELERRFPTPSLYPVNKGLPYGLGFWVDRPFFMATVGVVFSEIGHLVPEAFKQDRAKLSGAAFSTEAMQAAAPYARDQWRAHASFIAEQLADGRKFLLGDAATAAEVQAFMNFWWLRNAVPHVAATMLEEFPRITAWMERVTAIGHGTQTAMTPEEALAIAKDATPESREEASGIDPRGLKRGDKVTVAADDYGRDPIAGEIAFCDAHEIAILRHDDQAGAVAVHFPRAGFNVTPL